MGTTFGPVKGGTLQDKVFETMRDAIFSGRLKSGQPLRELQLAQDLNVSQSTVREALLKLAHVGLVTRVPNKGTTVTELSEQEIRERLVVRQCLEEVAFTEAARRMTEDDFQQLSRLIHHISEAIERNDYFAEAQADLEFHRFVWRKSHNTTLNEILNQISVPLFAFVSMVRGRSSENLKETVNRHEGLYDALRAGSPEVIRDVLREHLSVMGIVPAAVRNSFSDDIESASPGERVSPGSGDGAT